MKRILIFLCIFLISTAYADIYYDIDPPDSWKEIETMKLTAFSTPYNDSALLEFGNFSMLIDGGFKGARYNMEKVLAELGYDKKVNIIYNSHPHDDHIGAVIHMMRYGFKADEFISSFSVDYNNEEHQNAVKLLKENDIAYHKVENGETIEFGNATITFYYYPDGRDPNALSSVALVRFENSKILLTGDITTGSIRYFRSIFTKHELQADIMKYPHHGITAVDSGFIEDVNPSFIYITNKFSATQHVNKQLSYRNIVFKHTSIGRIIMITDGIDWYIKQYKGLY